jgi:ABC-type branched-subunit amino acid transport system substrate-binding protein
MAILLLLALTLFLPAGCAQKVAPSESAKGEIVVGIIEDLSGPSGGMGTPAVAGMTDCIRYINEEKGGVSGHPLRAIVVDNKMDSAITISAWDRMKSEGVPIVMSNFAGAAAFVMHEACQRDHIPMTAGTGTIDLLFPKEPSYYFSVGPQTAGTIDAMCKIIEKEWAQKGEKRAPKIGFDFVSVGTMPVIMSKGAKMYSEKRGWQYNITRTSLAPADVTTQVLQMKQFGCDYLYLMTTEAGSVAWFKELQRQSFRPIIFGAPGLSSEELWRAVGELCVGARSYQFSAQWTDIDIPLGNL